VLAPIVLRNCVDFFWSQAVCLGLLGPEDEGTPPHETLGTQGEERNQQDATNLIFILNQLSQYVSGITMPIFRRTRLFTTVYGVLHWLCWPWSCGAGTPAVCTL
jgi:hypothetical protein